VLDAADTALAARPLPPLGPGVADSGSTSVTIPAVGPGGYWVIAKADADGVVPETRERDNTRATPIRIGPPDLVVSLLQMPRFVRAGSPVDVRDVVRNDGGASAGPTSTAFYLSADAALDPGDSPLGSRSVPGLGHGDTSDATTAVPIPAGTASRTWFLIAVADDGGVVAEQDEGNNPRSRSFTVR
jgi:subtilase family serine protease